jgi:hypothetical protein
LLAGPFPHVYIVLSSVAVAASQVCGQAGAAGHGSVTVEGPDAGVSQ